MKVQKIGQVFVKATQFLHPSSVMVDKNGIEYDRGFALVEENNAFVGSAEHGEFIPLKFNLMASDNKLELVFPTGDSIKEEIQLSPQSFFINHAGIKQIEVVEVNGTWKKALSDYANRSIRLVKCLSASRAIDVCPVTFMTTGSLKRLEKEVGESVDPARMRAGFIIENTKEHEEDEWNNRKLKLGEAILRVRSGVPRCAVIGLNPSDGARDQNLMNALIRYREKVHLPDGLIPDYATPGFATYAEVLQPGRVAVGDSADVI